MKMIKNSLMNVLFVILMLGLTNVVQAQLLSSSLFQYKVRLSKSNEKEKPMLLMLHGYGSNEEDLFAFAEGIDDQFVVVSLRAPYTLSENSYAWYGLDFSKTPYTSNNNEAEKSRIDIGKFIDEISKKYQINTEKVYLLGFSQGAMMSLSCALTMPEKVAGAVILGGKLRDEVIPIVANNTALKHTKIYISHGKQDQRVPFAEAEKAKAFLISKGITPTFQAYNMGHEISQENFLHFSQWLTAQLQK